MPSFISDDEVERALDYLVKSASDAAKARAERGYVEDYLKVIKSRVMKEHAGRSGIEQEREAYSDSRYLQHLEAIRQAVEADAKHTFLRGAAEAKLDCWRTLCATERAMKL